MLIFRANEPIKFKNPSGAISDGQPVMSADVDAMAFETSFTKSERSEFGTQAGWRVFQVISDVEPKEDAVITWDGETWTVKDVRKCKKASGQVTSYRVIVG